jgi:2-oxoglutarate ferredoxin oxidoreductase subunit alpha
MKELDIVVEICGSAGEGTISAGEILSRFMSEQGFEIISFDSYPAEIRGFGKCVAHTRINTEMIFSPGKYADVLIALNDSHSIPQLSVVKRGGILIYDSQPANYHEEDRSVAGWAPPGTTSYGVPLARLAHRAAGNSRGKNMVALGALAALFHIEKEKFIDSIKQRYAKKKQVVIDSNVNSFDLGYSWTKENIEKMDPYSFKDMVPAAKKDKLIINGNQGVAKAALDSGIKLYAGYPITPATKIMEIMGKELHDRDGIMLQTEDEISAIGAVVGAGFAGKRAMTATSGPGFSLMTEFTGLSVMAEIPAVIVNSQRGGPSTGLPTKTEQSDFDIAVSGGSGDSPRIVLAPTDTASCYEATTLAFYLAEKYQTLVVLLLDFFLSNSIRNIDFPAPVPQEFMDANIAPDKEEMENYKRYRLTETGISPRTIPGTPGGMYFATGLEHDEHGRPNYDGKVHTDMTEKRFRKHAQALTEAPPPQIHGADGEADIGVISWGSSAGAARDAVASAAKEGIRAACFSSMMLSPFPEEHVKNFAARCRKLLVPELNHTGQFADQVTRILATPVEKLNFVNGLPMAAEDILQKIREI